MNLTTWTCVTVVAIAGWVWSPAQAQGGENTAASTAAQNGSYPWQSVPAFKPQDPTTVEGGKAIAARAKSREDCESYRLTHVDAQGISWAAWYCDRRMDALADKHQEMTAANRQRTDLIVISVFALIVFVGFGVVLGTFLRWASNRRPKVSADLVHVAARSTGKLWGKAEDVGGALKRSFNEGRGKSGE